MEQIYKEALRRYVGDHVLKRILEGGETFLRLGGELKNMTMYYQRIVGFHQIIESIGPNRMLSFRNEVLTEFTEIIQKKGGVVDRYDDCDILVFWGIDNEKDHAIRSCESALLCKDIFKKIESYFLKQEISSPKLQISVNTGPLILGNFGSLQRFHFTAVGDSVTTVKRLNSANDHYSTDILITEHTKNLLNHRFSTRHIDRIYIKGKENMVDIFQLLGMND